MINRVLGLVADDLTGAGDASVQFAKRGWETIVTWGLTPVPVRGSDPNVIAVTTDCRALSNDRAERLTADAVTALLGLGADRIFLKIDSTMRGSVRGQIAGALGAWRARHPGARAVVCPAYPRMGRTVESKHVLVNGEPVHRTAIGRDPVTPVLTSDMTALLPTSADITVVDAATDANLIAIAASITDDGPSIIPVGSGGLAAALAEAIGSVRIQPDHNPIRLRKESRILIQVTSLNPVSYSQVARLKAAIPDVVILLPPETRGDAAKVAEDLARQFAELIQRERWDALGLIGGDGAREALKELGATGIRIVDSLLEGVPLGVVAGGRADGVPVFTKAGGFGAEDALVQCVERLRP